MKRAATAILACCGLLCLCGATLAEGGGLGLGVGIVKFKDCDDCSTPLWLTANLRVTVNRNFALEPEVGWYRQSEEYNVLGYGYDTTINAFNFGGSALVLIPSEQVEVFAGGGAGGHMYRTSSAGESSTTTKLGIHFLGGVDLKATDSMHLFGAIRYEIIDQEIENVKQWKFYGGIRLMTP